jgi:hypothetical protein
MRSLRNNRQSCPRQSVRCTSRTIDLLNECRFKKIALERDMRNEFGYPKPRNQEVLYEALGNYSKLLSAKMRKEGIELECECSAQVETCTPPMMFGPEVDDA